MNSEFILACPAKGLEALQSKLIVKAIFNFRAAFCPSWGIHLIRQN
jgi:hypothetical protein